MSKINKDIKGIFGKANKLQQMIKTPATKESLERFAGKRKEVAKKMKVQHGPSMEFVRSTSHTGNPKDTKVTFKESGAYHKKMMEGFKSPGYQAHRAAKDRQRGIE